jgi:16S rRNA G966 N2-methylase RsmD
VLREECSAGRRHDLVLLDPPYERWVELEPRLVELLPAVLAEAGMVVVETDARTHPELPLLERTSRRYGNVRVTVYDR